MEVLFRVLAWVLNQSLGASCLMAVVILLRLAMKRAPKWTLCLLWALVAVRLICPLSIHSPTSAYQAVEFTAAESDRLYHFTYSETPEKPEISVDFPAFPGYEGNQPQIPSGGSIHTTYIYVGTAVWVYYLGLAGLSVYAVFSYAVLKRRTSASIPLEEGVFLCDNVQSPFLLGLIAPKIILPSEIAPSAIPYVIAHERVHRKHLHHWWKALGFALLTVHWFNPLCWLSYALFCRDLELTCDESACKAMDIDSKKAYANALLTCAIGPKRLLTGPLAFGEVGVKERVKAIGRYRKPAIAVVALCLLACGVVAALFLTEPPQAAEQELEVPAQYPQTPSIQYSADSSMAEPQISYQPFDNIMGYTGFVEHHLQPMTDGVQLGTVPHWEERYYYGWTDNGVKILGYAFGWAESQSDDFSVDLNSDGQEELVCSCVYGGDGAQRVQVYSLDESGQLHAWRMNSDKFLNEEWVWGVNASAEYYDGTRFCLDFFPIDQSGDAPVELPEEQYHPIWPEDFVEMDLYDAIGEQFRGQD